MVQRSQLDDPPAPAGHVGSSTDPATLLIAPESLGLLTSHPDAARSFAGLQRVVVDEIHALAERKRGDQLVLALARLQTLCANLRWVGLSTTVEDPQTIARFLARHPDSCETLETAPGPTPDIRMLETKEAPPGAAYAIPAVMEQIKAHNTT